MKLVPIQTVLERKFARQRAIRELRYDAAGYCVHIGTLSPGCHSCFVPDPACRNFCCGSKCNLNCPYCVTDKKQQDIPNEEHLRNKVLMYEAALFKGFKPSRISFSGGGEPLLYLDVIRGYMSVLADIEKNTRQKPWCYLYTNGVLADGKTLRELKAMGFDEIRVHLGASNFSKAVYANLRNAASLLKVVSVETPAWPLHRQKLFAMLPILEDIGVKHLNIGEIEVNRNNYRRISRLLPAAELYHCYETHLYDGGLVYDLMEEVIRRRYSYSVLDCNSFVKSLQRSPAKLTCHESIKGLCDGY